MAWLRLASLGLHLFSSSNVDNCFELAPYWRGRVKLQLSPIQHEAGSIQRPKFHSLAHIGSLVTRYTGSCDFVHSALVTAGCTQEMQLTVQKVEQECSFELIHNQLQQSCSKVSSFKKQIKEFGQKPAAELSCTKDTVHASSVEKIFKGQKQEMPQQLHQSFGPNCHLLKNL